MERFAYSAFKDGPDGNGKAEKKDHQDMFFTELEADAVAGPVLQEMALKYLKDQDLAYFHATFLEDLDADGYLRARTNSEFKMKPSQAIRANMGNVAMAKVAEMTKEALKK